jgi:hypothetical protein
METVLHKDGDQFAIITTAETEEEFRAQFVQALNDLIEDGRYDGDWRFQLEGWFGPAFEISCKYRGYKASVVERRTLIAGHIDPDAPLLAVGRSVSSDEALLTA